MKRLIGTILIYKELSPWGWPIQKVLQFLPVSALSPHMIQTSPRFLSPGTQARVAPNQRWFGNTRVIGQKALHNFQEEMGKVMKDPYQVSAGTSVHVVEVFPLHILIQEAYY